MVGAMGKSRKEAAPRRPVPPPPEGIPGFQRPKDSGLAQFGRLVYLFGATRLRPRLRRDTEELGVVAIVRLRPAARGPRCTRAVVFADARKAARFFDRQFLAETDDGRHVSTRGSETFYSPRMDAIADTAAR